MAMQSPENSTHSNHCSKVPPQWQTRSTWFSNIAAVLLMVVAVCWDASSAVSTLLEAGTLFALALGVVTHPSVLGPLRSLPTRRIVLIGTFALSLYVGQTAKTSRYTFPFVEWAMFGRPSEQLPSSIRYEGIRKSGRTIRIFPGASISDATISRLDALTQKLLASNDDVKLRTLLESFVRLDEDETATDPIVDVQLSVCSTTLSAGQPVRCEPLRKLHVRGTE